MQAWKRNFYLAAAGTLLLAVACNLDDSNGGPVYSCDAREIAQYCIEEPATPANRDDSKNTCKSVPRAVWSDSVHCPGGYTKKCQDGDKVSYYYAQDDASKSCAVLSGEGALLNAGSSAFRTSFEKKP